MNPTTALQLDPPFNEVDIFLFAEKFYKTFLEYMACLGSPAKYRIRGADTIHGWLRANSPPTLFCQLFEVRKDGKRLRGEREC